MHRLLYTVSDLNFNTPPSFSVFSIFLATGETMSVRILMHLLWRARKPHEFGIDSQERFQNACVKFFDATETHFYVLSQEHQTQISYSTRN